MKRILLALAIIATLISCAREQSPRIVEDFNFGWKFQLGDEAAWAMPNADDNSWRNLHLPHDWSIEGEFSADNPSTPGGGALPGGIGWYRKHFSSPNHSGRVYLEFDGVFMNSTVYLNGVALGTRPYGYSSFTYDITDHLRPVGETNVVAVRCDNAEQPNSRWYAGCGIYRDVRLMLTSNSHIAYNGSFVSTPSVSNDLAMVSVALEIQHNEKDGACLTVCNRIISPQGAEVSQTREDCQVVPGENTYSTQIEIPSPQLWSLEDRAMYTLRTEIRSGSSLLDVYDTRFGVRTAEFDADKGFLLNGDRVKLLGVCLHHDMGALGTAVHKRAIERQLTILKDMGCNAIRTAHNPPAPVLLDLCDEMGFLVIDEAMDMWRKRKTEYDYSRFFDEWHKRDIQDFIRRDRNHPSVIMWSVGNEILEQWSSKEDDVKNLPAEQANILMNFMSSLAGYDASEDNPNILLTKHMVSIVKDLDTTRAVSAGCNETQPHNNLLRAKAFDVYGFNYHTSDYPKLREWYPGVPIYASETVSSINSRGVYFQPSSQVTVIPENWWTPYDNDHHQCTAYDACRVPWGDLHSKSWLAIKNLDWMAGTFVWTGFDYLGEPTPYSWPSRSSYFGIVDLAGFPKDAYYMYQSEWTDKTVLHLFPHWNWSKGDKVDIWAYYSNADEVELLVNGKTMGMSRKEDGRLHAQWLQVPFEPGRIEVVSYKEGKEVARASRVTAGAPAHLSLTPDRGSIEADGYDLAYVTVQLEDAEGNLIPNASDMLEFSVSGCGELVGVDNGNPCDTLSLKGHRKALFNGKALAIVRSIKGETGTITLSVKSAGESAEIHIAAKE